MVRALFQRRRETQQAYRAAMPAAGTTSVTTGLPSVSVPVLSTASTLDALRQFQRFGVLHQDARPAAPRPVPTMIAVGVASPSAQGQAITSTATALTSACGELAARTATSRQR